MGKDVLEGLGAVRWGLRADRKFFQCPPERVSLDGDRVVWEGLIGTRGVSPNRHRSGTGQLNTGLKQTSIRLESQVLTNDT